MKASLKMRLGNKEITIASEGKEKEVLKEISFFSQLPDKCGACDSSDISLSFRAPKDYEYYGMHCLSCGADLNFGQYKSGGFFIKGKWERYQGNESNENFEPGSFG